jgi:hypothetical protein
MPGNLGRFGEFVALLGGATTVFVSASLAAPIVRHQVSQLIRSKLALMFEES